MCTARSSSPSERLGPLLFAVAALAWAAPAAAQSPGLDPRTLGEKQLVDPLDGHEFTHQYVIGTNGLGGHDSDGCTYARGVQPRVFAVATSPTTLFSARMEQWPEAVPPDLREALLRRLVDIGKEVSNVRDLKPSERYELAAVSAELLGASHFAIGELYLIGAWTVRDTIVGFLPGVQGASDAWVKLGELVPLAQQQTEAEPRTRAMFDLARLSHRGGFVGERDEFLMLLDTFEDAGIGGPEKRAAFFRRVGEENRLLGKARERFRKGIAAGEGSGEEQAFYRFLAGDLARRLGDFDAARTDLEAVDLSPQASEEVRLRARDVLEVIKVQKRPEKPPEEGAK